MHKNKNHLVICSYWHNFTWCKSELQPLKHDKRKITFVILQTYPTKK